jgi:tetratricopeptide (TPR) repeat protein
MSEQHQPERKLMENLDKFTAWSECYGEALGMISREEYSDAINALNEAESRIDANKTVQRALIAERIAYCFHRSGKTDDAEKSYEQALTFASTPLDENMFELRGKEQLPSAEERKAAENVQADLHKQREKFREGSKKIIAEVLTAVEKNFGAMLKELGRDHHGEELSSRISAFRKQLLS